MTAPLLVPEPADPTQPTTWTTVAPERRCESCARLAITEAGR